MIRRWSDDIWEPGAADRSAGRRRGQRPLAQVQRLRAVCRSVTFFLFFFSSLAFLLLLRSLAYYANRRTGRHAVEAAADFVCARVAIFGPLNLKLDLEQRL